MSHDDFAFEPVKGLPELPPEGEYILWQGNPDWWALSREALNLWWVVGYFVLLAVWRFGTLVDQTSVATALVASAPFLILGAVVAALLMLTAYIQARSTVYTITNRRVAMRIGAALTVTLNLPFSKIARADLGLRPDGTGTIAMELMGDTRMSYLVCWPHVRPWRMARTQPALRCIPDAASVARLLSEQAQAHVAQPVIARTDHSRGVTVAAE